MSASERVGVPYVEVVSCRAVVAVGGFPKQVARRSAGFAGSGRVLTHGRSEGGENAMG
jgi:hypothetical protein